MTISAKTLRPIILVFLLWMAGLGAAGQFTKLSVFFTEVRAVFPTAGAEIGWLLSTISILGIVFGMFSGLILHRLGFRKLLLFALVLGAGISLYQSTLPTFWPMIASRVIEGISHLIIVVAAPTLIIQVSAISYRKLAMTLWSTFFGVAFALTAWLGIPMVEAHGFGGILVAHGVFLAVIAVLLYFTLPRHSVSATAPLPKLNFALIMQQHVAAYRSPHISAPAVGWLFYTLTFVSLLTILPELVPQADRAFVVSAMPLVSIVVALVVVGLLQQFMSAIHIVMLGFASSIAITSLLFFDVGVSVVGILLFCTLGLIQGASFASVPELNSKSDDQSQANGAMAQLGNLGNTIGTPALLAVLAAFGLNGMIVAIIVCYGAGLCLHLVLQRAR